MAAHAASVEILAVNARGGVTLPKALREQIPNDSPVVRVTEVGPGKFLFEAVAVIPLKDQWYHTPAWQAKEREADAAIAEGRTHDISELGKHSPPTT